MTFLDKGLILYVQNRENPQSSCGGHALLREVNGTLFAPDNFKQYRQVAMTGIVPISTLEELFTSAQLRCIKICLEIMEFCHPVDPSALQDTNLECNKATLSMLSGAAHLFFPSLIKEQQ